MITFPTSCRALLLLAGLILAPAAPVRSQPGGGADLIFSTYLGGAAGENLRDITTDSAGFIYVTGGTSSPDFPTTPGAYDRTFATGGGSLGSGGPMDVFITKLTPDGQVVWSTFFGGPNYDRAYAIEVDRQGFVYVGGRAGDSLPTTAGVLQERFAGDLSPNGAYGKQDGFIAKISPDGARLVWATYFGSDDIGFFRDIDIDSEGNVYGAFTNSTSPNVHVTPGAFRTASSGGQEVIVAKISPDASRVVWATYLGGSGNDGLAPSIRVDAAGHAFVVAGTNSTDIPVTPGAADPTFNGGNGDFFVTKLLPDGSGLVYCTYFGGSGNEGLETHNLAIDSTGNAWICGFTTSSDLPVTPSAFQKIYGGNGDSPLAKISPDGTSFLAVSYLGGPGSDGSQGIAIDGEGNVIFGGGSGSGAFPTTAGAFQPTSRGGAEAFIAKMSGDLSRLHYSTLVGGTGADDGRTAWADRSGRFYVAGHSRSDDYPLKSPWQATRAGADDGVITVFGSLPVSDTAIVEFARDCAVGAEESGSLDIVITRSGSTTGAITMDLALIGTAILGSDFTIPGVTITIPDGASSARLTLSMLDDNLDEGTEHLSISMVGVTSGSGTIGARATMQVRIIDDERAGRNILSDPGFESAGAGWQKTTNGGRSIVTSQSHSGTSAQQMILSSQFAREVYQDLPVTPGRTYIATGWLKSEGAGAGGSISLQWLDGTGAVIAVDTIGSLAGSGEWSFIAGCASVPAAAATVRFRLYADIESDNSGMVWYDDLALFDADEASSGVDRSSGARPSVLDLVGLHP